MGTEFGGNAFTAPTPPIYPNTEWHIHVCDPALAEMHPKAANPKASLAKSKVEASFPGAIAYQFEPGWVIVDNSPSANSCNSGYGRPLTDEYFDSIEQAWEAAAAECADDGKLTDISHPTYFAWVSASHGAEPLKRGTTEGRDAPGG
jgi:hypothetical protein